MAEEFEDTTAFSQALANAPDPTINTGGGSSISSGGSDGGGSSSGGSSTSNYVPEPNDGDNSGFFNDNFFKNRQAQQEQNKDADKNDKGSADKKGKKGKKGAVFGNAAENYDKTYVYSLLPEEHGVFYKVQIIPTDGSEDGKVGNDYMHKKTLDAVVTAVNMVQSVRQQINYTLGNTTYLYVFGENVTELTIGGFGFWKCKEKGDDWDTPMQLIDFYKANNVSVEGKYCKVLLGNKTFKGYLISSDIGFTEQNLGLVAFKFMFIGVFE